jgi:predicted NUDIX family NTP pyrophosphohydrolase
MKKRSAGILLYKRTEEGLLALLVHPGGPFWARKDLGCWSIPKGEHEEGETPLEAAKREFEEELGVAPQGAFFALGELAQPGGKIVSAWAAESDFDASAVKSNLFEMEWPPRSGAMRSFPEVDRAEWFPLALARDKILPGQRGFLDRLAAVIGRGEPPRR